MPAAEPSYVELERTGGQVPTYRPTVRVDVAALSAADRQKFDELTRNAPLAPPAAPASKAPIPDGFTYRLTVKLAGQPERTLTFGDQDGHPASLDHLADWIRARGSR